VDDPDLFPESTRRQDVLEMCVSTCVRGDKKATHAFRPNHGVGDPRPPTITIARLSSARPRLPSRAQRVRMRGAAKRSGRRPALAVVDRLRKTACRRHRRVCSKKCHVQALFALAPALGPVSETSGCWARHTNQTRMRRDPLARHRSPFALPRLATVIVRRRAMPLWPSGDEMGQPG
jgi:hypothetical protein